MKTWRPRMRVGQVAIRQYGLMFAVICRNKKEADYIFKKLIKHICKFRESNK